ncbi:MAG: S-methyl-5-thioribose-1-phosphate isomerase [Spirochaetes bacterium]|jgi:methylthioribose-1-phosphate isomerase|nr:S-methyl-5-thioribose-1-phosphate isomerase [Spirochaetota bacterium]
MYAIKWNGDSVVILDQRLLPLNETYHTYTNYMDVLYSIKDMEIRGAPAIGVAGAMGVALAAKNVASESVDEFRQEMNRIIDAFASTRKTGFFLFIALNRMKSMLDTPGGVRGIRDAMEAEAVKIYEEDIEINRTIGRNGSGLIQDGDVVMTHCNAGALATAGYGTALGVIRAAVEEGKKIEVYACETRPYLQGARITALELFRDGIPVTLITDSMSGHFMKAGVIKKIVVGADRIAANGDTANKVGTYTHSVLAREHGIPFYIAASVTIIDPDLKSGEEIPIEERTVDEVAFVGREQIAPEGISIRNPSFDVTPAKNITAIITEKGLIENPGVNGASWILKK